MDDNMFWELLEEQHAHDVVISGRRQEEKRMTRLAKILEQAGIRQTWLAEKTGLTRVAINRYVHGNRVPKVTNAIKIAMTLGMNVEMIWGCEEDDSGRH